MSHRRTFADGMRFGNWTLVEAYPEGSGDRALCRCDCGTVKLLHRAALRYANRTGRGGRTHCNECRIRVSRVRRVPPSAIVGRKFGSRVVVEADENEVVLRCERCQRPSLLRTAYLRSVIAGHERGTVGPCRACETISNPTARATTGVTRQAIDQRIRSGWTREEASTTPKGQTPERIREIRRLTRTRLTGKTYGPFVVVEDERNSFHDHVTVRATCCGAVSTKAATNLKSTLWQDTKRCIKCREITKREALATRRQSCSSSAT